MNDESTTRDGAGYKAFDPEPPTGFVPSPPRRKVRTLMGSTQVAWSLAALAILAAASLGLMQVRTAGHASGVLTSATTRIATLRGELGVAQKHLDAEKNRSASLSEKANRLQVANRNLTTELDACRGVIRLWVQFARSPSRVTAFRVSQMIVACFGQVPGFLGNVRQPPKPGKPQLTTSGAASLLHADTGPIDN